LSSYPLGLSTKSKLDKSIQNLSAATEAKDRAEMARKRVEQSVKNLKKQLKDSQTKLTQVSKELELETKSRTSSSHTISALQTRLEGLGNEINTQTTKLNLAQAAETKAKRDLAGESRLVTVLKKKVKEAEQTRADALGKVKVLQAQINRDLPNLKKRNTRLEKLHRTAVEALVSGKREAKEAAQRAATQSERKIQQATKQATFEARNRVQTEIKQAVEETKRDVETQAKERKRVAVQKAVEREKKIAATHVRELQTRHRAAVSYLQNQFDLLRNQQTTAAADVKAATTRATNAETAAQETLEKVKAKATADVKAAQDGAGQEVTAAKKLGQEQIEAANARTTEAEAQLVAREEAAQAQAKQDIKQAVEAAQSKARTEAEENTRAAVAHAVEEAGTEAEKAKAIAVEEARQQATLAAQAQAEQDIKQAVEAAQSKARTQAERNIETAVTQAVQKAGVQAGREKDTAVEAARRQAIEAAKKKAIAANNQIKDLKQRLAEAGLEVFENEYTEGEYKSGAEEREKNLRKDLSRLKKDAIRAINEARRNATRLGGENENLQTQLDQLHEKLAKVRNRWENRRSTHSLRICG